MKFYIDFEATQFTNHILSIGCVSETGACFKSLVRPLDMKHHKLTRFITDLTGITKEDLEQAPDTNQVFNMFYQWWCNNWGDETPEFICYGNCDKGFVRATLNYVTDLKAIMILSLIHTHIVDYGPTVAKHFGRSAVGLKRVYNLIKNEDEMQKHDALEDAEMLKFILENLDEVPADIDLPPAQPKLGKTLAPEIFRNWPGHKHMKFEVDTLADENTYKYKCTDAMGIYTKYFDSLTTAALWVMKFLGTSGLSPKKPEDIERVKTVIQKAIRKGIKSYGFSWEMKEEC